LNVALKKLRNKILQDTYRPGKSKAASMKSLDAAIESNLNALLGKRKKKSGKAGKEGKNGKEDKWKEDLTD